jgi:hypothetical protein
MRWRDALLLVGMIGLAAAGPTHGAPAQPLNKLPPARAPCTVLSAQPCHPSFCDVFHRGSCFPQYEAPIGEDFRLTIVTTDDDDAAGQPDGDVTKTASGEGEDKTLGTVGEMYAALRACWVPPPKDTARHGMQYTVRFAFKRDGELVAPPFVTYASHDAPADVRDAYRDAVDAALTRCTPLHFSHDIAEAVVGHPIAVRFVDDRTVANAKSLQ